MKNCVFIITLCFLLSACASNNESDIARLKSKVDSLSAQIEAMKPGLGEYMLSAQIHHNKLWFAGRAQNWELAKFESDEIIESFSAAATVCTGRSETKLIPMIYPALDSLNNAIAKKDTALFTKSYELLTNTCNNCHSTVHFEFNEIKIPDKSPFTNQVFEKKSGSM